MAEPRDQAAEGGRVVLLIAVVALSVTSAAGFGRVFQGSGTSVKLAFAAGVSALIAGALERRNLFLAVLASAVGLAFAIALLVFPETVRYGVFPSWSTAKAAAEALREVGHAAAIQVAPALPLRSLTLAGLTAVWTSAFAAHALAARARSPFLALLPPASLMAFAGVLVDDGARFGYAVMVLLAALALLFADSLRRVGTWGPVSLWHGRSGLSFGSVSTGRTARRVAVACVAIAAFTPWLLPGFRSPAVLRFDGSQGTHVSLDPIVDIRPSLVSNRPLQLFTVRAQHAAYWRSVTLDDFDGRRWTSSNLEATGGTTVENGNVGVEVATPDGAAVALRQHFQFDHLNQQWLPMAASPFRLDVKADGVRYDSGSGVVFAPGGTYPGFSYDVTSTEVEPSALALDRATVVTGPSANHFTYLPPDTPATLYRIAHRLTDGQPTPYRKIMAVQRYLLDNFTYSLHVRPGHDTNHILYFLTVSRKGYCEQFAGSMAVLLRALGIPSRVAVGFTPGSYDPKRGIYHVTGQNAHAWVETWFNGYGWLPFEPTPGRSNPSATYASPNTGPIGGVPGCTDLSTARGCGRKGGKGAVGGTTAGANPRLRLGNPQDEQLPRRGGRLLLRPARRAESPVRRWAGPALEVLGLLVLLLLVAIPVWKMGRRRLLLARAHGPKERVLAAFEVMTDVASDVGVGRRPAETLAEYRRRLADRVSSAEDLDVVMAATGRAAYAEDGLTPEMADLAMAAARRVKADVRRSAGPARRIAGTYGLERLRG